MTTVRWINARPPARKWPPVIPSDHWQQRELAQFLFNKHGGGIQLFAHANGRQLELGYSLLDAIQTIYSQHLMLANDFHYGSHRYMAGMKRLRKALGYTYP